MSRLDGGDPPREAVEKFSVQWYVRELQDLFAIAADAQRTGEPEFGYIVRLLQRLSQEFITPEHIQHHLDDSTIVELRAQVSGLQRGTEEFFNTVEIGRWLRVCQEAIAQGRSAEEISRLVTPLIKQKLHEFGLRQPEPVTAPSADLPLPQVPPALVAEPRRPVHGIAVEPAPARVVPVPRPVPPVARQVRPAEVPAVAQAPKPVPPKTKNRRPA